MDDEPGGPELSRRAAIHAALGEPIRLAMVDELAATDRSPTELAARFGLPSNLLAHHLDVLAAAGLVERFDSAGDRRRRYVRLVRPVAEVAPVRPATPTGPVVFVCTHNSARSQLAAALWRSRTGRTASSAGTHPAEAVHPGAIAAARRAGLDLGGAEPRRLDPRRPSAHVITVCDRAHEELDVDPSWWHWSVNDPAEAGTDRAFDDALRTLDSRIRTVTEELPA